MQRFLVSLCAVLAEAVTAVDRTVVLRLERHFRLLAAVSADDFVHLALLATLAAATALLAAVTAANRLVLKAFFRIKLLLACAEDELLAAVLAYQRLVFESHNLSSPLCSVNCQMSDSGFHLKSK